MWDHEKDVFQPVVSLSRKVGPLFYGAINMICLPNGRHETNCMAMQFMCHPTGFTLSGSPADVVIQQPILPKLKKFEAGN